MANPFQNAAGSNIVGGFTQLPYSGSLGSQQVGLGYPTYRAPSLSDYDIELMAVCIANQHPQVEGRNCCFCALKRLEKGIGKE